MNSRTPRSAGRAQARIYRGTPRNLALLARRLREGEIAGVPTETVYGLAGNALDPRACEKIFRAKGRPADDPLIVHIHALDQLEDVAEANDAALRLAKAFWPGPLTLVLPKKKIVPNLVTAGRNSVAVRMPSHRLFRRLLKLTGLPLAAPSANPFGYISPTTAEHVRQGLGTKIRYVLDGGPSPIGVESTIVDLRDPARPRMLRPGAITLADLRRVLGKPVAQISRHRAASAEAGGRGQIAPGLLTRHYSPRTRLELHASLRFPVAASSPGAAGSKPEAYVFLRRPRERHARIPRNIFWLDERGDLEGVARRLFATLRKLDGLGFVRIHVELAPEGGLGHAINDRLRRAAAR